MSSLVHMALLWLLVTRLAGDLPPPVVEKGAGGTIRLYEVAEAGATPPPPAVVRTGTPAPDVDVSAASELPPPEWAIVRMRVPPAEAPAPRTVAAPPAPGDSAAPAAAGPFDPYAGAALVRRPADGTGAPFELDTALLARIVAQVSRGPGRPRGSAEMMVRISAEGRVLEARILGGSAPAAARLALQRALVGGALYRPLRAGAGPQTLRLPSINLG